MSVATVSPETEYAAALARFALFPIPLDLLQVGGHDAGRYLQGRITQDINRLAPGEGAKSLLLTPQGRVLGHFVVLKRENDFLVLSEPADVEDHSTYFTQSLLRFKVADQVDVEALNEKLLAVSLQGPEARSLLTDAEVDVGEKPWDHRRSMLDGVEVLTIKANRGAADGYDLLVPNESYEQIFSSLNARANGSLVRGSFDGLEMLRISAGLPRMGPELGEKTVATEVDVSELISFTKGCYAGQEVVEMSTARGRPNRTLILLQGDAEAALAVGTPITTAEESDKTCGEISSSTILPSQGVTRALGFVKTKYADHTSFQAGGVQLQRLEVAGKRSEP